jgi:hypothetical protein
MRKRLDSRVVVELSTLVETFMARNMGFQYEDSVSSLPDVSGMQDFADD